MPELVPVEDQFVLSKTGKIFNRLFAALLVISSLPLLQNLLTLPTVVIFVLFACFLFFSRKYHPLINFIFLIFALGIYFIPLPIAWGLYRSLKGLRLSGFVFQFPDIFLISQFIFVFFSVKNVLGNILAYFKLEKNRRRSIFLVALVILAIVIITYPLLDEVRLRRHAMEDDSGDSQLSFLLTSQELKVEPGESASSSSSWRDYLAYFDLTTERYIYRLNLVDPLAQSLTFVAVKTDGEKINFRTDSRIKCPHCQMGIDNPYSLTFPAGKDVDFIIESDQLIKVIEFTETGNKVANFAFWK